MEFIDVNKTIPSIKTFLKPQDIKIITRQLNPGDEGGLDKKK